MTQPKPIASALLDSVTGGATSPLGTLSLFIARTNNASRVVAKSFDVLTLLSPPLSVARFGPDDDLRLPIEAGRKRQRRGTARVEAAAVEVPRAVDDPSQVGDAAAPTLGAEQQRRR
jgi:hypothetical protein